ncbi:hypothetical protein CRUP_037024 [Coryphaenoides rupestris]|nr:hypothetical protein CRUP_037024 [Coryphaenoides rupestris]
MEDQEMQLKVKRVSDKFTESMYVLANEPSVALYRLQEHVRSAVKSMANSSVYFKSIDGLLRQAISMKEQISNSQGRR